jgi:hypothetical protein
MDKRITIAFLLLILTQGLHSVEEYMGNLWEVFLPATFLSGLVADNHETGFLIINTGLFVFGLWSWMFPVRLNYSYAPGIIWFWIVIETINGIGHPAWSLYEGTYTPGVATAPALLILAVYLSRLLLSRRRKGSLR